MRIIQKYKIHVDTNINTKKNRITCESNLQFFLFLILIKPLIILIMKLNYNYYYFVTNEFGPINSTHYK